MREDWPKAEEWDRLEWLHVYGQYSYHSDATIRATRAGLVELRGAIDKALSEGEGQARVIASDGEGYRLQVVRVSTHDNMGSPEYIYETHGLLISQEAKRARELGLNDPFGEYMRLDDPRAAERIKIAQQSEPSTDAKRNETGSIAGTDSG